MRSGNGRALERAENVTQFHTEAAQLIYHPYRLRQSKPAQHLTQSNNQYSSTSIAATLGGTAIAGSTTQLGITYQLQNPFVGRLRRSLVLDLLSVAEISLTSLALTRRQWLLMLPNHKVLFCPVHIPTDQTQTITQMSQVCV